MLSTLGSCTAYTTELTLVEQTMGSTLSARNRDDRKVDAATNDEKTSKTAAASPDLGNKDDPEGCYNV